MKPNLPAALLPLAHAGLAERLAPFVAAGIVAPEDAFAVDLLARRLGETDRERLLGLVFAARGPRVGQVGAHLRTLAAQLVDERGEAAARDDALGAPTLPEDAVAWEASVLASTLCGAEAEGRPFVRQTLADGSALLMPARMAALQRQVARALRAMVADAPRPAISAATIASALPRLFPDDPAGEAATAVRTAATQRLTVVTGGPGTGKTYSVTRTLALLLQVDPAGLRVALAAPTGKAAVRMREAIAENLRALPEDVVDVEVRARVDALGASTLHRLIGLRPDGSARHHAGNPLPYDVVVVDEVSMVDLAMMQALTAAMPAGARLVLLGDRDQLASVDAGTVLGDVVRAGEASGSALAGAVVRFTRSRRFAGAPTIAHVAAALQRASAEDDGSAAQTAAIARARAWLCGEASAPDETLPNRVRWLDTALAETDRALLHERLLDALGQPYDTLFAGLGEVLARQGVAALAEPATQLRALLALERYRVLATHRRGLRGVAGLQRGLEARALRALERAGASVPTRGAHWLGRPLLVTQNDPATGLMNGDVGMVLPVHEDGTLGAVFVDREQGEPRVRTVTLSRLPSHESALAMTVHKSQGSQFEEVALVLHDADSPIQTRELVYTGITRAAVRLRWSGPAEVLQRALSRRVARASGLAEWLAADR
ncbi:MAG: exodeoxyribonuclease subunit alpha [Pseudomonadota bacterium]